MRSFHAELAGNWRGVEKVGISSCGLVDDVGPPFDIDIQMALHQISYHQSRNHSKSRFPAHRHRVRTNVN